VGLWLCGCQRACPDCLSPDFWAEEAGQKSTVTALATTLIRLAQEHKTSALTISGGEPFGRGLALLALLKDLRETGISDILVYSGFLGQELLAKYPTISTLVTALVDGAYETLNPSKEIFRGSKNQKLWLFDQNLKDIYDKWSCQTQRQVQIIASQGQIRLLGVPKGRDFENIMDEVASLRPNLPLTLS
jgi:anaerobic ribonucleoside-triphosphate reductase activating protein